MREYITGMVMNKYKLFLMVLCLFGASYIHAQFTYSYYIYKDGEYVLSSETSMTVNEDGSISSAVKEINNGVASSVGQDTTISNIASDDPSISIVRRTTSNDTSVYEVDTWEKLLPWGVEVIKKIVAPGTANEQVSAFIFYTDAENDGSNYGRLKAEIYPDGSWVRYEYDTSGRQTKVITPFGNANVDADESLCQVQEYSYAPLVPGDTLSNGDSRPRTAIRRTLGIETGREYYAYLNREFRRIVCTEPGAAWDAPENLVTVRYSYPEGHAFSGRHWRQLNPNGTMSITSYSISGNTLTTIVDSGTGSGDTVTDGTRSISVTDSSGYSVSSQSIDIASGLTLSSVSYTNDGQGRIIRSDYDDGTFTSTVYACCGPAEQVNREGIVTSMMYDAMKRLIASTTAGVSTLYAYDANGNVTAVTTKASTGEELTAENVYNATGKLISSTDHAGNITSYSESVVDSVRTETTTNPDGSTVVVKYNLDGTTAEISGTATRHVKYEYGTENGELYTKVINVGNDGDESNWTKSYTNFAGQNYKTTYADGSSSLTEYDNYGRPIKQISPAGVVTLTAYNEKGEVAAQAVDMNRNGIIDYSGTDRITGYLNSVTTKSGLVVRKNITRIYQQNNSATPVDASVAEYSTNGRHSWNSSFGQNSYSATVLNGNGSKTVTVNNPDGSTIVSAYQDGRIISSTHSVLGTSNYEYDGFGRIAAVRRQENGILRSTIYSYDGDGRILALTEQPSGKITSYTYDSMGHRTSAVLPGGRSIYYEYYPTGELKKIHGADTYTQVYAYDAQGRMSTLTTYKDASTPQVTSWVYNNRGFMTGKNYADGNGVAYDYNADGQLTLRTWARGITTTYTYDNAGTQTGVTYSDGVTPAISYTLDRLGRPVSITDASGTIIKSYNADSSLASESVPYIVNHGVQYGYDALGRRTSINLMNASTSLLSNTYGYDAMSRLASVGDGSRTAAYTRVPGSDALANTTLSNSSGAILTTNRTYDNRSRMTSIASTAGATTRSYAYVYNDKDQRSRCTLADGSYWLYSYDDKGQVIGGVKHDASGVAIPGMSFGYDYDGIGNRKQETRGMPEMLFSYSSNLVNQYTQRSIPGIVPVAGSAVADSTVKVILPATGNIFDTSRNGTYYKAAIPVDNSSAGAETELTVIATKLDTDSNKDVISTISGKYYVPKTPQAFTYDPDGNMSSDGKWNYTWNGENRLIVAESADKRLEFAYDYMGRRVNKQIYTGSVGNWTLASESKYVYDGWNCIAIFNGSDVMQKSYLWGEDLSGSLQGAGGVGGLLAVSDATATDFPMYDGNGNIMTYVDPSGTLKADYTYDPFGRTLSQSGDSADIFLYRFSTKLLDTETDLYYYGYRYYSSDLGRWLSRDPIEEQGGYNLYGMVGNNPISHWDYLGLKSYTKQQIKKRFKELNCIMKSIVSFATGWMGDSYKSYFDKPEKYYLIKKMYTYFDYNWYKYVNPMYNYYSKNYTSPDKWTVKDLGKNVDGRNWPYFKPAIDEDHLMNDDPISAIVTLIHEPNHDTERHGVGHIDETTGEDWADELRRTLENAQSIAKKVPVKGCCATKPNMDKKLKNQWNKILCDCEVGF